LWAAAAVDGLPPFAGELLLEACRLVDRLDRLDALLRGDSESWARVRLPGRDAEVLILQVDSAMSEARQQALALKQIFAELRVCAAPAPPAAGDDEQVKAGGGNVLDLRAIIAERLAQTSN